MLKNKGKKRLIVATLTILSILVIAIGIAINKNIPSKKSQKQTNNPELAKAMSYDRFEDTDADIYDTNNVKFGAFFLRDLDEDGYAEKIKGTCKEIGTEDTLYMELNVLTEGYLENGVITINGNNFCMQTAIPKDNEIQENVIGSDVKEIKLNQINNGTQKLLTGMVRSGDYSYDSRRMSALENDITKMSQINSVTLTGTYVDGEGNKTNIEKTIDFTIDWYGTTKAEIPEYIQGNFNSNQLKDNTNIVDEEKQEVNFEFNIGTQEIQNQLFLKKVTIEGEIPQLNGYDPIAVEITGNDINQNYNQETKTFTVEKEAEQDEYGKIIKQCFNGFDRKKRYNKITLKITYPLEAYSRSEKEITKIEIPVKVNYEGFNNQDPEFTDPYISNEAQKTIVVIYRKPVKDGTEFRVDLGKYEREPKSKYIVSKKGALEVYNGISSGENNDEYIVRWSVTTGEIETPEGLVMKETKTGESQVVDKFIKTNSLEESMENITSNIGIYFENEYQILGEDGWIKVYNEETGELIHEFTKADWSNYTEYAPYTYENSIKHIRIETSPAKANSTLQVFNVKNINDIQISNNYTKDQFDELEYIQTTLVGYANGIFINTDQEKALYDEPYTYAELKIEDKALSTQNQNNDITLKISALGEQDDNKEKWKNGIFLVKFPKSIIDIKINEITSSNPTVKIESYEILEENEEKILKIITSNKNKTTFDLTINSKVSPDPRILSTTDTVELYVYNEDVASYYNPVEDIYDINGNENITELVGKYTDKINLIAPNTLLTNETISNYDNSGNITIAPRVAEITKSQRTATVNIEINSNYSNTISQVKVLGKVPFEGNKYSINGNDMNSKFTTTMSEAGIQLPEELQEYAQIYYSENGEATKDLDDSANGWTQTPTDYSKIKSYLIDLGDKVLNKGEKYTISYNINIPENVEYNKVTYSHHAVYFSLDTVEGKYKTQTEPNKIGIMVAKKYDLEVIKYQKDKEKLISGATYQVYEDGQNEAKTKITNDNGTLKITGLYLDRKYKIKEIKSPIDYELNNEEIEFTANEENNQIVVNKTSGTTKDIQAIQDEKGYKIQIKTEDEAKAKLKIEKTEKDTGTSISGVKFRLSGNEISERYLTTNSNGEVETKGLKIGEEYTLEEVKAEGYYSSDIIKFIIENTDGTYNINLKEGNVKENEITEEDSLPKAVIKIQNEKIPTYNLEISKVQRVIDTAISEDEMKAKAEQTFTSSDTKYLSGAKFKLYKDTQELGEYTTDTNGKITITGLYQYIEGKDEEAVYTLKEILPPNGYTKSNDITFKVENTTGELKLINTNGDNEPYTVDGNTIKLIIENSPSFKLIKKDAETNQTLANVKFAIYKIDNDICKPATNSKGEIIGEKEIINGKEYYTITTNNYGELTADLPEGIYKAVEIKAPKKYDISNSEYFFGIGKSREGLQGLNATFGMEVGTRKNGEEIIYEAKETSDGGTIEIGFFDGESLDLGNGIVLTGEINDIRNGIIIKYNSEMECQWAKSIKNSLVKSIAETIDGGIVIGGYFSQDNIDLGNGIVLNKKSIGGYDDGMIVKYNSEGECEWAKVIGGESGNIDRINSVAITKDGGIIAGGQFNSKNIELENSITIAQNYITSNGIIIKYNTNGEIEWAKQIGGESYDYIYSVEATSDGGIIAGGEFETSSLTLENGTTLNNSKSGYSDGMIIKYNSNSEIEWAKTIGTNYDDEITSIVETTDGDITVGGESAGAGLIIRYNKTGDEKWSKQIGTTILSVTKAKSGAIIAGGCFAGSSLEISNQITLANNGEKDGMLIKYSKDGEAKWAKAVGGSNDDEIYYAQEKENGTIQAVLRFRSSEINLENNITVENPRSGYNHSMYAQFETVDIQNIVTTQEKSIGGNKADYMMQVMATNDGGYIASGLFSSASIDLGNGVVINKGTDDDYQSNGLIIKYNSEEKVEWAKAIGKNTSVVIRDLEETSDGGYLVAGCFWDSFILEDKEKLINNGYSDAIIIKYSSKGELEWTKTIGSSENEDINSIKETSDGGIIVGGSFMSPSLQLENGIILNNSHPGYNDGMIIKYNANREAEWAKTIGKDNENDTGGQDDEIIGVVEMPDGGFIAAGSTNSNQLELGNDVVVNNKQYYDGIIL